MHEPHEPKVSSQAVYVDGSVYDPREEYNQHNVQRVEFYDPHNQVHSGYIVSVPWGKLGYVPFELDHEIIMPEGLAGHRAFQATLVK